jgi:hypothetical protein
MVKVVSMFFLAFSFKHGYNSHGKVTDIQRFKIYMDWDNKGSHALLL